MSHALVIHVRLHEGRYNGEGDWPPCPSRLFQALVAAGGLNGKLASVRGSLEWLQKQPAPIVGAPRAQRTRQRVMFYMPNNDLDAVQGDPQRIAEIRSATKVFQPYLFDADVPFLYAWAGIAEDDKHHADAIRWLADLIYQLGRGSIWHGRGVTCSTLPKSRHDSASIPDKSFDHAKGMEALRCSVHTPAYWLPLIGGTRPTASASVSTIRASRFGRRHGRVSNAFPTTVRRSIFSTNCAARRMQRSLGCGH